ncbi:MAG TPA: NADH-quinone oxidoreductase subunit NuoE [Bacillota bacterium]|nr:NADH-quinone oxidoreductase subunit NuoE [Bacillota bacterium]HRS21324.1 NADH-quinone oxidoreductase subunit NuoE [Clostridia bacterium]HRU41569.1 NADH-quinone oxidoreductase subunit NuoE [Candidatus Diapherotrites archaeon]HQE65315.1 NADH-quinone oxidoreductase subunit NuoE [Bacillota bacterium]HQI15485.1 NADH-quinone oxidoreductase subunit NuoE [Bacillota bacterium]
MYNFYDIVNKYERDRKHILAMLQDIQREYNHIPREAMNVLSEQLDVPLCKLYGIATFYKSLSLRPKGRNIIKVCDGTACHIRSSQLIMDELEKLLGIKPGETSRDGEFTLETVNCLGSCAIAPVMVINETYYGKVTPAKLRDIIKECGGKDNE